MTSYPGTPLLLIPRILGRHYDAIMIWDAIMKRVSWDAIMTSYPGTPL